MAGGIQIAGAYKPRVASLLTQRLALEPARATAIVADGTIEPTEFFEARHFIKALPSSARLSGTPAVRLLDDNFFQKAGLDRDLFNDLVEETFGEAAAAGGPSDEAVDSEADFAALDRLLGRVVQDQRQDLLDDLKESIEEAARELIQEADIQVSKQGARNVHVVVRKRVPLAVGPLKRLFYDEAAGELPRVAKKLFARNTKLTLPAPPSGTAADQVVQGGLTVHSEIYTPVLPNRQAYVHVTLEERRGEGSRRTYVIRMKQLTRPQEGIYRLGGLPHRMGWLEGTITLTELASGETDFVMDVTANPDLAVIPDRLIKSFSLGIPGLLLGAGRDIAAHLTHRQYFERCLRPENASPGCRLP